MLVPKTTIPTGKALSVKPVNNKKLFSSFCKISDIIMGEGQLSAAEQELYDRQIRLWGIESQEKLRAANVLLIGIRGLGSEIAKNILLSGINSLTILDDGLVDEDVISCNFLINHGTPHGTKIAEQVLAKAQALNPLVKIETDTESVSEKNADYFKTFTLIVATEIKFESILKIDSICRESSVKFIYGDVVGTFGFAVADFLEHEYYEDRIQLAGKKRTHDSEKTVVKVKGKSSYPPLNKVLILPNTKQEINTQKRITKNVNLFVCALTLLEFRRRFNRNPSQDKESEDTPNLKKISDEIITTLKLPSVNLDAIYEELFERMPPVYAILGGIIAQEIIKAVSHKEVTINNIFLFDPVTYSGKELTVGA